MEYPEDRPMCKYPQDDPSHPDNGTESQGTDQRSTLRRLASARLLKKWVNQSV
jgi:hypothetical protein